MAKRFTDTKLYSKAWFRKLPPRIKCLWEWLRSNCDHAGVVEFDPELASFQIGEEINHDSLDYFGDRVEILSNEKVWLVDFVAFQYGNLKENYNPHKPVITSLKKHGLFSRLRSETKDISSRVEQDLGKTSLSLVDKDKDKDKDKVKDKEKESAIKNSEIKPTEITEIYNQEFGIEKNKSVSCFISPNHMAKINITMGHPQLQTRDDWIEYFKKIKASDFLCKSHWATFTWLTDPDNAVKVLEGKYDNAAETSDFEAEDPDKILEGL